MPRMARVEAINCSGFVYLHFYPNSALNFPEIDIPGCPPQSEAIMFGILMSIGRIEEKRRKSSPDKMRE